MYNVLLTYFGHDGQSHRYQSTISIIRKEERRNKNKYYSPEVEQQFNITDERIGALYVVSKQRGFNLPSANSGLLLKIY